MLHRIGISVLKEKKATTTIVGMSIQLALFSFLKTRQLNRRRRSSTTKCKACHEIVVWRKIQRHSRGKKVLNSILDLDLDKRKTTKKCMSAWLVVRKYQPRQQQERFYIMLQVIYDIAYSSSGGGPKSPLDWTFTNCKSQTHTHLQINRQTAR